MSVQTIISNMPDVNKAVVILSGGMDSSIVARLAVEKYGKDNVSALTFYYKQKQSIEIDKAKAVSGVLGLAAHTVVDLSFLGDMVQGVSANIMGGLNMPTIKEILGDPTPVTYVPNRNMIMLSIAAAYAETVGAQVVLTGLQSQDEYSYFDTTPAFVAAMNSVTSQMRKDVIQYFAPFQGLSKSEEIEFMLELDGGVDLLKNTMTCYNPEGEVSCGKCPSCAERIKAFMKCLTKDPVPYAINIPWKLSV